MNLNELQSLNIRELNELAQKLSIQGGVSGLNKQELIVKILETHAKKDNSFSARGVLEVMQDGYGFLRSPDYNYMPGPDDIYVSPSQIKRFGMKTGHLISGQIRPPKSKERFYALLKVETVNDKPIDKLKDIILFDNFTPLYPEEKFNLETKSTDLSMRIMDLISPIGKGQRGLIVAQPKTGKTILLQKLANSISNNHFYNTTRTGDTVYVSGDFNILSENYFENCGLQGYWWQECIQISGDSYRESTGNIVSNNTLINVTGSGIAITSNVNNTIIRDNLILGRTDIKSSDFGILLFMYNDDSTDRFRYSPSDTLIYNNTIRYFSNGVGCDYYGYGNWGFHNVISSKVIY